VLTRYALQKYQASSLYLGTDQDGIVLTAPPPPPVEPNPVQPTRRRRSTAK
jgi:hypothetical protein